MRPVDAEEPGETGEPGGSALERHLLARRRAIRAADEPAGPDAASAALERTVESLHDRVAELERDAGRAAEQLDAERAQAAEREHELRRLRQREYSEQQQRAEADGRAAAAERRSAASIEQLRRQMQAGEAAVNELTRRVEELQGALAGAERSAAAARTGERRQAVEIERLRETPARRRAGLRRARTSP